MEILNDSYNYLLTSIHVDSDSLYSNYHKMIAIYDKYILSQNNDESISSYIKLDSPIKKIKSFIVDSYKGYITYVLLQNGKLIRCDASNLYPNMVVDNNVDDFGCITTSNEIANATTSVFVKSSNNTVVHKVAGINLKNVKSIFDDAVYLENGDVIIASKGAQSKYAEKKVCNMPNVKKLVMLSDNIIIITDTSLIVYDINKTTQILKIDKKVKCIEKYDYYSVMIVLEDGYLYEYYDGELKKKSDIKNIKECGVFKDADRNDGGHHEFIYTTYKYILTENNDLYCIGGTKYGRDDFKLVANNVKKVTGWNKGICYMDNDGKNKVSVNHWYINKYVLHNTTFESLYENKSSNNISVNQSVIYLKDDNTVMTCGNNQFGQLGLGDTKDRNILTKIPNITDVKQVCCSDTHSMILFNDGTISTCGSNRFGQLGLGNNEDKNIFTKVPGITNVEQISCGGNSSMIKLTDGSIMTCGDNTVGQLCLGDNKNRNTFTKITI